MKTPRWREYRGLPKWWCGCRRFPGKFTACSQITSMIHFVLREKTTRCTGSSMWPVQVLRTSGRNSSGTADSKKHSWLMPSQWPNQSIIMLHSKWMNDSHTFAGKISSYVLANFRLRAVPFTAELVVSWQRCDMRIETSSFLTRLNTLAASLHRYFVDPGFLLKILFFHTQLNDKIMLIPKKSWNYYYFWKQKVSRHVPSLKSSNLQSYQNRFNRQKVRDVESSTIDSLQGVE